MANVDFVAKECTVSPYGNSQLSVSAECDYAEVLSVIPIESIIAILGDELLDEIGVDKCIDYFDIG